MGNSEKMGSYYADFIGDDMWGVFHTDNDDGFCYATFLTETEAQDYSDKRNIEEGYE